MSAPRVYVRGVGAVSPAGWGAAALVAALENAVPLPTIPLARPGWDKTVATRPVPTPATRPAFLQHARLRRAGPISQYAVAAGLEALGTDTAEVQAGHLKLGIVVCVMAGGVSYSRRFFEEVLRDPLTASPLVFSETVFNAPASHLAAFLGIDTAGYTVIGDDGAFLQGLAMAAQWIAQGDLAACLVVGAEEVDWIVSDAMRLFDRSAIQSGGAGALYLSGKASDNASVQLSAVTDSFNYSADQNRTKAARGMRAQLPNGAAGELLCSGERGSPRADRAERSAWEGWPGLRQTPRTILGEAFVASTAWQCVAACQWLRGGLGTAANVSIVGANQQAIGARFVLSDDPRSL